MLLKLIAFIICGILLVRCQDASVELSSPDDAKVSEVQICSEGEFRCKDSTCIEGLSRCNGTVECPDRSDETFALCRNEKCSQDQFRCAYGACVNGAACDNITNCADNSDEILTRCLPESERTICDTIPLPDGNLEISCRIKTECVSGQWLEPADRCDGKVDCADGSDETVQRCGEVQCANNTFKCAYGGCVHGSAQCNGISDCADASDESEELCGRRLLVTPPKEEEVTTPRPIEKCIVPHPPTSGYYQISSDNAQPVPGDLVERLHLVYSCKAPYKLVGEQLVQCYRGVWSSGFPECKLHCKLFPHPSVKYHCLVSGNKVDGSRVCNLEEPSGTVVKPECVSPNYYYPGPIPLMHCDDEEWDFEVMCIPECGRKTPQGAQLIAGGRPAERDEVPWHAGIYTKLTTPYSQICGGSILNYKVIISAAHCFWRGQRRLPPKNYAVAAGKLYREWEHPDDTDSQHRDVIDIKIPARYQGVSANFQDDIALVVLVSALSYTVHVRPVCIDFDYEFDARQLQPDNKGTVAGWGLTSQDGEPSPVLKVVELPYVSIEKCLADTPLGYKEYITSDKICAGYNNGTAVCKGDSGGGLAFPESDRGIMRYYLRGVVSTAPGSGHLCNTLTLTSFTHLITHQHFIKNHFHGFNENGFMYFNPRGRNA